MPELPAGHSVLPDTEQLEHAEVTTGGRHFALELLADSVCLPVNVGSLFRLADAQGLARLHLCGATPCPPDRKLRRAARATEQVVSWHYAADALVLARDLKARGYRILCLELTRHSYPLQQLVLTPHEPLCLIVGNERHGVSEALLEMADASLHLTMQGRNSSMNVAMATAIACHHITSLQQSF